MINKLQINEMETNLKILMTRVKCIKNQMKILLNLILIFYLITQS